MSNLTGSSKIPFDVTFHPSWWHRHCVMGKGQVAVNTQSADNMQAAENRRAAEGSLSAESSGFVDFDEKFFYSIDYRLEADCAMRRLLYEKFGAYGLGEKEPRKRPILWTDLCASGFLFSAMAGCRILFSRENPPQVLPADLTEAQIDGLSVEKALASAWWQEVRRQICELQREYGSVISCINLQGIQNIAMDLRGSDFLMDYYDEPQLAQKVLQFATDLLLATGRELKAVSPVLSGGVTAIINQVFQEGYVHSNCTVEMISNDCFEEFLLPLEERLANAFVPYGVHHCGQTMEHVCRGYGKIPGLAFAEIGAGSDIEKVRRILGNDVHLNLRYSPVRLAGAGRKEIREEVRDMVRCSAVPAKTSVSCVGIDSSVGDDQIRYFLEAVREVPL